GDILGTEPQQGTSLESPKPGQSSSDSGSAVTQPTNIDPETFLPQPLTQLFEVEAAEMTLGELAERLKTNYGIPTIVDEQRLADLGLSLTTRFELPRKPSLPIYLVLDRLSFLSDLSWLWDDGVLRITTVDYASNFLENRSYH